MNLKKLLFDLPKTIFGSKRKIFTFNNLAAIQKGDDMYPPVLTKYWIFFFLRQKYDLNN